MNTEDKQPGAAEFFVGGLRSGRMKNPFDMAENSMTNSAE